ncbi:MAG TPA: tRNA guanosine(34) transglycosylase Tgt [Terriglobales bacterium]|nr:tRNA guanosine(34) transglycosylase Tgt [Terriglobales bacterium]
MSLHFQLEASSEHARAGTMTTAHGQVHTPVFMPVGTVANVKGVPQHILEEIGVNILLSNTYHLFLRPGAEQIRDMGGLHRFMSWDRSILTDSGGFQVFSLSSLRKLKEEGVEFRSHLDGSRQFLSPERAIEAQIELGADIIMSFDECTEYPADRARARESMELTLRWAERSKRHFDQHKNEVPWDRVIRRSGDRAIEDGVDEPYSAPIENVESPPCAHDDSGLPHGCDVDVTKSSDRAIIRSSNKSMARWPDGPMTQFRDSARIHRPELFAGKTQALFGIVQGGMYADLRKECAERLVEMDFPGYAIGGLSVGEPRELTYEMVSRTLEYLPKNKPRYVMGVGTPEEIVQYARLGVDMMDCVLPTRAARHGLLFTSEGRINIKGARYANDLGPLDPNCGCRVCTRYSRAYLRHLYSSNELLAQVLNSIHNVAYYLDTMRRVRHSILLGEFTSSVSGIR